MKVYKKREFIPIVKYNPEFRDENGVYQREEWTSRSDVGKVFGKAVFEEKEYIRVEEKYIAAFFLVLSCFKSDSIKIDSLFKHTKKKRFEKYNDLHLFDTYISLKEREIVKYKETISKIIRLALREYIQAELLVDRKSKSQIIFGFDYHMYLKTNLEVSNLLIEVEKLGLFTRINKTGSSVLA